MVALVKKPLTFRSAEIVYYGPFNCEYCEVLICRMAKDQGGNSFTYPDPATHGPIYPNTIWEPHICSPVATFEVRVKKAKDLVLSKFPQAIAMYDIGRQSWMILECRGSCNPELGPANAYNTTEGDAWIALGEFIKPGTFSLP